MTGPLWSHDQQFQPTDLLFSTYLHERLLPDYTHKDVISNQLKLSNTPFESHSDPISDIMVQCLTSGTAPWITLIYILVGEKETWFFLEKSCCGCQKQSSRPIIKNITYSKIRRTIFIFTIYQDKHLYTFHILLIYQETLTDRIKNI